MNGLKKLSPEERIKKLKEIEEKNKEEIKKAQKLMKESEVEIEEEQKSKRNIPIPQLRSVDVTTLFGKGTQEQDMLETKQFISKRSSKEKKEKELEEKLTPEQEQTLDVTIENERDRLRESQEQAALYQSGMAAQQRQYQSTLTKELVEGTSSDIYNMVKSAYEESKGTGYVSADQMEKINAASQAALSKLDAMVDGDYQASKQATDALVASARIAKSMRDKYKS